MKGNELRVDQDGKERQRMSADLMRYVMARQGGACRSGTELRNCDCGYAAVGQLRAPSRETYSVISLTQRGFGAVHVSVVLMKNISFIKQMTRDI